MNNDEFKNEQENTPQEELKVEEVVNETPTIEENKVEDVVNEPTPTEENHVEEVPTPEENQPEEVIEEVPSTEENKVEEVVNEPTPTEENKPEEVVNETTPPSEPAVEEVKTEQPAEQGATENPVQPPKKKAPVGLIIGIVAGVLVLFVVLFLLMLRMFASPKDIVNTGVSTLFKEARVALKATEKNLLKYDFDKDSLGLTGDLTIESNYKTAEMDLSKLKDYKLNYSAVISKKSNEASAGVTLTKSGKEYLKADGYVEGKTAYFSFGEMFSNTLKTKIDKEVKDLDLSTNDNIKDIDRLLEKTEKIVLKSIDKSDIKQTKEEKDFYGKKATYKKIEYTIKQNELSKNIYEAYLSDDEILEILANISQKDKSDIKKELKDELDALSRSTYESTEVVNIYLSGLMNNAVAYELVSGKSTLLIVKNKGNYIIKILSNEKEIMTGEYDAKTKTLNLSSELGLTIKATFNPEETVVDINYAEGKNKASLNAVINNKVKSNMQENNITLKIGYSDGYDDIDATIKSNMKLEKNKKVNSLPTSSAIDVEQLSDAQLQGLLLKITEKLEAIEKEIMPSYNSYNYDDDFLDDYDYDSDDDFAYDFSQFKKLF